MWTCSEPTSYLCKCVHRWIFGWVVVDILPKILSYRNNNVATLWHSLLQFLWNLQPGILANRINIYKCIPNQIECENIMCRQ